MWGMSVEHAAVPGRLRVRIAGLQGDDAACRSLEEAVKATGLFDRASARARTGSLIAEFTRQVPHETALDRLRSAVEAMAPLRESVPAKQPADGRRPDGRQPPASKPTRAGTADGSALRFSRGSLAEIERRFETDLKAGLSGEVARNRLKQHGPNALPEGQAASPLQLFMKQFESLPVVLLAGSAVVSVATGGVADAVATMAVVVVNGVLGYVTEGQAERTIRRLIDTSEQSCTLLRDGVECVLPARTIVPGDIMLLRPGHHVAADARLIAAKGLLIDESALTGESVPVMKYPGDDAPDARVLSALSNMVFAGTIVTAGSALAVVVATGADTQIAAIQHLADAAERPRAPVEQDLDDIGRRLVGLSLAACGVFFGVGWLRGYSVSVMLKDALALAVAAVPEGLPTVATTTMARGIRRMEKSGILIRRLDVVESLGALQTLCLDKTGTLTANTMAVAAVIAGSTRYDVERGRLVPAGGDGDGDALRALMEVMILNNEAQIDPVSGAVDPASSSATERALLQLALDCGEDISGLRAARPFTRFIEREDGRRYTTTVHEDAGGRFVTVKGSPAEVLSLCERHRDEAGLRPLTSADRTRIMATNDALASMPARVLAFASGAAGADPDDTQGLVWHGIAAMIDPLRPGSKDFIAALHRAGIATTLITGDQMATAQAVAEQLDLGQGAPIRVIDAGDLAALDPALLSRLATQAHAFARVSPQQKLAIVRAIQDSGRVVGMTGDGVNDGPALKAADVGIAMGQSGTNLARDVANVVIADDRLPTLVSAIAQGRTVYRNIRRSLEYLVTTNLSEIMVSIVEAVHGPGELETPMELLWINLVTDILPGLGLAMAEPDADVMDVPPRDGNGHIIPGRDATRMGIDASLIAAAALATHFRGLAQYGPGPQTRGMTFNTLVMSQLLYTLGAQRFEKGGGDDMQRLFANRTLDAALVGAIALQVLPFSVPWLRRLLGIAPMRLGDLAFSLAAAAVPVGFALARHALDAGPDRRGKEA
ncbi:Cation-transporting ATPase, E1-E2 type [Polymorphum gilvum SL003B-26A1]|uniref:Cation-transporting ATPase, E1-E2 type n=2 Tax=Polymorphum TaxID=991903 RepID=F2IXU7_POLGS|nr:Cation-transporting ATPase, E1-E2 type [Polymorphum gilvum SL003B-26A1]